MSHQRPRNSKLTSLTALLLLLLTPTAHTQTPIPPPENRKEAVRELLELMRDRLNLALPVAQSKWNSGKPISDPQREKQILARMRQQATIPDLNADWVESFFQAQIEANKSYQQDLHQQWTNEKHPPFSPCPDLVADVRPVLDDINRKLLTALMAALPTLQNRTGQVWLQQQALATFKGHPCSPQTLNATLKPLMPPLLPAPPAAAPPSP